MRRLAGNRLTLGEMLSARSLDALNILVWQKTKDGRKNRRRPPSVFEALAGDGRKKEKKEVMAFTDGASFMDYWKDSGGG